MSLTLSLYNLGKPNAFSNSFEESSYGWILKHRGVSFATDNPQEKCETMWLNYVHHHSVSIYLHITFPAKRIFLNDAITLIVSICILNFHCVSYPFHLYSEICGPHGYFNVMPFTM